MFYTFLHNLIENPVIPRFQANDKFPPGISIVNHRLILNQKEKRLKPWIIQGFGRFFCVKNIENSIE